MTSRTRTEAYTCKKRKQRFLENHWHGVQDDRMSDMERYTGQPLGSLRNPIKADMFSKLPPWRLATIMSETIANATYILALSVKASFVILYTTSAAQVEEDEGGSARRSSGTVCLWRRRLKRSTPRDYKKFDIRRIARHSQNRSTILLEPPPFLTSFPPHPIDQGSSAVRSHSKNKHPHSNTLCPTLTPVERPGLWLMLS